MKTLFLECNMGAAGDMLVSSLIELLPNPDDFIDKLNNLNIPKVRFKKSKTQKCGIAGTHVEVLIDGDSEDEHMHEHKHNHSHEHRHHHTGMQEIENIIRGLDIPDKVCADALSVYKLIAEAESHAHGCEISQIHFHEVGTMDAVADVVAACMLIYELAPDEIIASPVNVGSGQVKCAHGVLPVPAPATAYILRGTPIYSGDIKSELCTPTGAALLKYFVSEFKNMPVMTISKIGYGMGTKDFESANCLRAMLGETLGRKDVVFELCCNIDDMTGEEIGFATSRLFETGALDVFTAAIGMKKNRPGILLTCVCDEKCKSEIVKSIFKYTSTIGIREHMSNRYVLDRKEDKVRTKYGDMRVKTSSGYGTQKSKIEYDDVEKAAIENDISVSDVRKSIKK